MPREGTKTGYTRADAVTEAKLRLNMPREGTKTFLMLFVILFKYLIEIKYAPGGDENIYLAL